MLTTKADLSTKNPTTNPNKTVTTNVVKFRMLVA